MGEIKKIMTLCWRKKKNVWWKGAGFFGGLITAMAYPSKISYLIYYNKNSKHKEYYKDNKHNKNNIK